MNAGRFEFSDTTGRGTTKDWRTGLLKPSSVRQMKGALDVASG